MARELTRQRSAARNRAPVADGNEPEDNTEDEQPRGRRSRRSEPEEETKPSRRKSRRGADEETPRSTPGGRGWAAHAANKAKTSKYGDPNEFRVEKLDEEYLIKFLEDSPFWSFMQHFVREIPKGGGKKQFTCPGEDDCPLCDIGYPASSLDLYNIVDLSGDNPVVKYWICTSRPSEQIEKRSKAKSSSPINRDDLYFSVSKTEDKSGFNVFDVSAIKEDDVEDIEGWEDKVLTDEDWDVIEAKGLFDESVVVIDSLKTLRAAAEFAED